MKLQEGKKYKIRSPKLHGLCLIHIDYILENKISKKEKDSLILYRYWNKSKKCWIYFCHEYWKLCIYNDWYYYK